MGTVTGLTADRMLQIEAESVVDGNVDGNGHLILTKHDGTTIDAGSVIGPTGPQGVPTPRVAFGTGTQGTYANQWTRLATVKMTSQYADASLSLRATSNGNGSAISNNAFVDFRVKQQNAMGAAPAVKISVVKIDTLDPQDVAAVIVQNDATATVVDLYFYNSISYDTLSLREIAKELGGGATVTYYTNAPYVTALPAGAVTYGVVSAFISEVLASANSYADTGDTNAKSYADSGDASTRNYADTGDSNTLASAKSYSDSQLTKVTEVTTVDFNTLTSTGYYHQGNNANAANCANCPVPYAGLLKVVSAGGGGFIYQEYTTYQDQNIKYHRSRYSGIWSAWSPGPWTSVTWGTGFTDYGASESYYVKVRRDNNVVYMRGLVKKSDGTSFAANTTYSGVCTIPLGFRPDNTYYLPVSATAGFSACTLAVSADGSVQIRTAENGPPYIGMSTFWHIR